MTNIKNIINFLDKKYPANLKAQWDLTDGLLEGDIDKQIKEVYVSLELNQQLIEKHPEFVILHHPPKFGSDKKITNPFFSKLKNCTIYSLHSRIDVVGDVNKALAEFFFEEFIIEKILDDGTLILSLIKEKSLEEIISLIKEKLELKFLKVIEKKHKIKRIAIHGGEGFNKHHVDKASAQNIDLYLAGDLTHHLAESAFFYDVSFIDIEHVSEKIGMKKLCDSLKKEFSEVNFIYVDSKKFWSLK